MIAKTVTRLDSLKEETKRFFQSNKSADYDPNSLFVREMESFASKYDWNSIFLDFGAGNGQATQNLSFKKILSVDNAQLPFHNNAEGILADCECLPLKDNSVDCGISINVFHHLFTWKGIREISRVLKPGGRFLFIDKTGDNPLANLCYYVFKFLPKKIKDIVADDDLTQNGNPVKIRLFRHKTMRTACIRSGLIPIREERSKIISWFVNYTDSVFGTKLIKYGEKLDSLLMKTPLNDMCVMTIMEVEVNNHSKNIAANSSQLQPF